MAAAAPPTSLSPWLLLMVTLMCGSNTFSMAFQQQPPHLGLSSRRLHLPRPPRLFGAAAATTSDAAAFQHPRHFYARQRRRGSNTVAFAAADGASPSPFKTPPPPAGYRPKVWAYYRSRSKIIEWYCQELGVAYDTVQIDMGATEHKAPEFIQNVNPFGKLPVITMADNTPIHESGAQLLYLADVFDPHVSTAEQRGLASQWTHFANASLGPAIFMKEQREAGVMDKLFTVLDQQLALHPYLEGERFGVSDVAVGSYLSYIPVFFPGQISLEAYPHLQAYIGRITSRPAFKNTVGAPPPSTA